MNENVYCMKLVLIAGKEDSVRQAVVKYQFNRMLSERTHHQ